MHLCLCIHKICAPYKYFNYYYYYLVFTHTPGECCSNRWFLEITGKDNLTVFSYSGRMEAAAEKSRSATVLDLQAWTYDNLYQSNSWGNLLSDLHVPHKQWALDRYFWCLFCLCLWVSVILPTCSLYPQQKRAYSALHPRAWTYIIIQAMPVGTYRVQSPGFPKIINSGLLLSACDVLKSQGGKRLLCGWLVACTVWKKRHFTLLHFVAVHIVKNRSAFGGWVCCNYGRYEVV